VADKKRGLVAISSELLLEFLHLEGQILDIRIDHFSNGRVEMVVENSSMPDCPEGGYPVPVELRDYQT